MGRNARAVSKSHIRRTDLLMILVLLGTQQNDFSRLLKAVDKAIEEGNIKEEVIVQAGSTKYKSDRMKQFDLIPKDEIESLKKQAHFIITHGGVGSIVSSLKMGKKIIAVPRLQEYGEHVNNHQIEIVESFAKQGYIMKTTDLNNLSKVLSKIENFEPKKYISNTEKMIKLISDYIDKN